MLARLRPALIITRREIRDQFRDWRIIIPIVVLTLLFPGLMNFTAEQAVSFVERYGAELIGDRLIPFLLMVVGFFPISVSLVIALESFVGEKERGSIEPLLCSPLSDGQLYLGKLLAVMVPPLLASYLGIAVYLFGVYRDIGWSPEPSLLLQILALTLVQALVMVSGAVVVSTQATSVRAANLLASFIIIPFAFLIQGESLVMFWGQYDALWWAVAGQVIIAGLLVRTGVNHFNREELLGREMDVLDTKWMWHTFVSHFKGEARSLGAWYRREVGASVRRLWQPVIFVAILMLGALWVGGEQAKVFVIPPEVLDPNNLGGNLGVGLERFNLFSTQGALLILWQNVRALLLATFLGIFSYGVLGVMVVLLPTFFIGYFLATLSTVGVAPGMALTAFVLPHGVLELPAILLAGAAIYRMGASLAASDQGKTMGESLLHALADWAKVMAGVVLPLLAAAALMEALVTPRVAAAIFGG